MKLTPAEIDRRLETPVENEVQKRLRVVLEAWGPNGERHLQHDDPNRGTEGDKRCLWMTYYLVYGGPDEDGFWDKYIYPYIAAATNQLFDGASYHSVSASSFQNARTMVHRAIELAAAP